jgi:hypothetical protein
MKEMIMVMCVRKDNEQYDTRTSHARITVYTKQIIFYSK